MSATVLLPNDAHDDGSLLLSECREQLIYDGGPLSGYRLGGNAPMCTIHSPLQAQYVHTHTATHGPCPCSCADGDCACHAETPDLRTWHLFRKLHCCYGAWRAARIPDDASCLCHSRRSGSFVRASACACAADPLPCLTWSYVPGRLRTRDVGAQSYPGSQRKPMVHVNGQCPAKTTQSRVMVVVVVVQDHES